jgi:hypothetical protein
MRNTQTTTAISNVSRKEFNRLFTFDSELAPFIGDELEWYADDAKNVIGTIARGILGSCWGYTILRRNVLGDFLASTLSRNFMDLQTARVACLQEMAAAYHGQDRVESQRD